jgi:hypothetical protein
MFLLLGKGRKELKKLLNSIPEDKKKEIWQNIERIALEALKIYIEGQVNRK